MRADLIERARSVLAALAGAALLCSLLEPACALAQSATLTWTAPGDDGQTGQASSYEMRYSVNPVAGDTVSWWAGATSVGALPAPQPAGARESFVVTGLLANTTYSFVLRSRDEASNVSGFSNVAVKQASAPTDVTLGTPESFAGSPAPGSVLLTWKSLSLPGAARGLRMYRQGTSDQSRTLLTTLSLAAATWSDTTVVGGKAYDYYLCTYDDSAEGTPATVHIKEPKDRLLTRSPHVHSYPNPARAGQVTFRVTVDAAAPASPTRITVFDLAGRKICQLPDQVLSPGNHAISWCGKSDRGGLVAPGLYSVIVDGPSGRSVTQLAIVP
jgi:hypothetical protein